MDEAQRLQRLADLAVRVGANVQPGQLVVVSGFVENVPLIREIARASYRAGARRVEAGYRDMHFVRALIELGPDEALSESMPWDIEMVRTLVAQHGAFIQVSGDAEPTLLADLDGTKVARAQPNDLIAEYMQAIGDNAFCWTIVPAPNPGWAREIFGKPDMDGLWQAVEKAVRLDYPSPVEAWQRHIARLKGIADALTARRFDSLRYRGPGTDFTVGLLPTSIWKSAGERSSFWSGFRAQHPHRGGVHVAGPAPGRGQAPLDEAAAAGRHDDSGPRGRVQQRPHREGRCHQRRRRRQRPDRDR